MLVGQLAVERRRPDELRLELQCLLQRRPRFAVAAAQVRRHAGAEVQVRVGRVLLQPLGEDGGRTIRIAVTQRLRAYLLGAAGLAGRGHGAADDERERHRDTMQQHEVLVTYEKSRADDDSGARRAGLAQISGHKRVFGEERCKLWTGLRP